ncbi:hypothetical protein PR048_007712 [Dryococelus australis]|uniref:Uncharacterized protein n=1 Tax=Dryococelus australis TaxID=614101 RepID=A0ABQ9HV08_9NEOP|nr:hypothetical protein PR048_007712 [Dryococelus australis]
MAAGITFDFVKSGLLDAEMKMKEAIYATHFNCDTNQENQVLQIWIIKQLLSDCPKKPNKLQNLVNSNYSGKGRRHKNSRGRGNINEMTYSAANEEVSFIATSEVCA